MQGEYAAERRKALAVLGLPEAATWPQITRAYRRLVRATHPDATGHGGPEATEGFTAVHDAYRLLAQQTTKAPPPPETAASEPPTAPAPTRLGPRRGDGPRPRAPIVAGPVVVTELRDEHRRRGR